MNHLVKTSDGSHTIYVPELNEHYHSVHGAVQESEFIFIKEGYETCKADPVSIFEVGFGTGLNALLTASKSEEVMRKTNYTSIEKYPLDLSVIKNLNHHLYAGESGSAIFEAIHSAPWDERFEIVKYFNIRKIRGDILTFRTDTLYDLIYFDAFGPDKQPELWSHEVFSSIASFTKAGGILVTYSAKGAVRRTLRDCGFEPVLLPGPPGKRQIIRAVKK